MDDLNFDDLEPIRLSVNIRKEPFVLCEASAGAAARYRNLITKGASLTSDGRVASLGHMHDAEPRLISDCLFYALKDSEGRPRLDQLGRPVPEETVRSWPQRLTSKLFEKIKEISPELEKADTEEALEKQIAALQAKLAKLREAAAGNGRTGAAEGQPGATTATSV